MMLSFGHLQKQMKKWRKNSVSCRGRVEPYVRPTNGSSAGKLFCETDSYRFEAVRELGATLSAQGGKKINHSFRPRREVKKPKQAR